MRDFLTRAALSSGLRLRYGLTVATPRREAARPLKGAPQEEVDLAVDAPQLVGGPALQRGKHLRLGAQQKRLACSHRHDLAIGAAYPC